MLYITRLKANWFGPMMKNLSIWLNGLVTKLFSLHNRKKVMKKFMMIKMTPTTPMLDEFP